MDVLGKEYVGQKASTEDGDECQRWDSQFPWNHTKNVDSWFPEGNTTLANNYCRWVYCFTGSMSRVPFHKSLRSLKLEENVP